MEIALGIIIGILLSIVSLIGLIYISQKTSLHTRLKQVESTFKKKGEVFEPNNEDLENWVDNLPKQ